jgi:hypothetical protein
MVLSKYKILSYAILASLVWHLFWLSAVKVVVSKPPQAALKFGRVSFLGPILSRNAIELKISPRQRSLLEKRYLAELEDIMTSPLQYGPGRRPGYDAKASPIVSDRDIKRFVEEAVAGAKLEPDQRF